MLLTKIQEFQSCSLTFLSKLNPQVFNQSDFKNLFASINRNLHQIDNTEETICIFGKIMSKSVCQYNEIFHSLEQRFISWMNISQFFRGCAIIVDALNITIRVVYYYQLIRQQLSYQLSSKDRNFCVFTWPIYPHNILLNRQCYFISNRNTVRFV